MCSVFSGDVPRLLGRIELYQLFSRNVSSNHGLHVLLVLCRR